MFFSLWRPERTASALSGSLLRRSAPKMEDDIVRSVQWVDEFASHETTLRLYPADRKSTIKGNWSETGLFDGLK